MTSFGQHACIVGSAAALKPEDLVYTQYREQGAHIWRGYTIQNIINQCIGNINDAGKGRQMPVHYGSKDLNNVTVSSPLSKHHAIQPHKYPKQPDLDTLSEQQDKAKWQLAILAREQPVKVISPLH